jgi:hypothetical protein
VAVETMRALVEAMRVLTLWQFLNMQRLYNVYSTCIVAVETMRALVEAIRVPGVWQS